MLVLVLLVPQSLLLLLLLLLGRALLRQALPLARR